MIDKLRFKFILAAVSSLFLVLVVLLGLINILNYREVVIQADRVLAILQENNGVFPSPEKHMHNKPIAAAPQKNAGNLSPELPYESRYFTVQLDANGGIISVNTGKIAAIDTEEAMEYAQAVFDSNRQQGFYKAYRYSVSTTAEQTQVIFLDCQRSLSTLRTFFITSVAVSAVGLAAVLLLMIFFSGKIVKPFLEAYQKQKQFITNAGHELKTPLTIIDADLEILQMDFGENEWIEDIKGQSKRLADLTNQLILLSRMEEGEMQFQMIEFPFSDRVEETVLSFQNVAKTKNQSFHAQIEPMLSLIGDEKSLGQLVTILLENAVKYTPEHGHISVTLEKQKNILCLQVYNTVDFIAKEKLAHLFDRFYRTDESRNSQTGGYGLGLSIAQAIVKAHNGKISASTKDEKSLLIMVSLPIRSK